MSKCLFKRVPPLLAASNRNLERAAGACQPANLFATKSQFTRFQKASTYLGRALR